MIAKVVHGWRPGGLLAYLFGPGKHEEHQYPRVVSSWDGAPWLHQPDKLAAVVLGGERIEPGEFDFDLGPLTTTMTELAQAAGLPVSNPPAITPEWEAHMRTGQPVPPDAPAWVRQYRYNRKTDAVVPRTGYVWHTPVRLHPKDRTLTDQEWDYIAERLMRATGIQQAGCRWVAVRHADDHIHLVATLVSERTGKRFYPRNDWYRVREECQALEREFGLVPTPDADWTAQRTSNRAEKGKAERTGRDETVREELRRLVTQCAAAVGDGEQFLTRLADEGVRVRIYDDERGGVRGYAVALPTDLTFAGEPVWYSGTKLARDLTWPKLLQRWSQLPAEDGTDPAWALLGDMTSALATGDGRMTPAQRRGVLDDATTTVQRATEAVRTGRDVDGIAHATGEVLAALTRGQEGRDVGPFWQVADRYDRAARTPYRIMPRQLGPLATELRRASRRIARVGALSGRGHERFAVLVLVLAVAGLIAEIATWQQVAGRPHQAAAARAAAGALPGLARPDGGRRRPAGRPAQQVLPSAPGGAHRERPVVRRDPPGPGTSRPQSRGPS